MSQKSRYIGIVFVALLAALLTCSPSDREPLRILISNDDGIEAPGIAALFEALIPLKVSWFGLSTVLLAFNPGLLDLCARSGCRGLLVGFESLSGESVRSARKGFNTPRRYGEIIRTFHSRGISLMALTMALSIGSLTMFFTKQPSSLR